MRNWEREFFYLLTPALMGDPIPNSSASLRLTDSRSAGSAIPSEPLPEKWKRKWIFQLVLPRQEFFTKEMHRLLRSFFKKTVDRCYRCNISSSATLVTHCAVKNTMRITEAEWEVMAIVWECAPVAAATVVDLLEKR